MYFPKRKRTPYTYKRHLEIILYHIKRAHQEMQKEVDAWEIDKLILFEIEISLYHLIRQEEQKEKEAFYAEFENSKYKIDTNDEETQYKL